MPLLLHPFLFMDELVRIDETLPPSLRFFLCITIVGLMYGGLFFTLLCSYKVQKKKQFKEFNQREDDIFM